MKAVCCLESSKALDHNLIDKYSLSEKELIDNAAKGAYDLIKDKLIGKKVLFIIGKGNNGSDGLEIARLLSRESRNISLLYISEEGNSENMRRRGIVSFIDRAFDVYGFDVIVDSLFGFGFHGTLDSEISDLITRINQSGSYVISIDVSSAMMVIANETIVFMTYKQELFHPMYRANAGIIRLVNPGFPESELEVSSDDCYLINSDDLSVKPFSISDYKNTRGHVCILGGSDKYPGAPILSIRSAIKSGAGLATLISSDSVLKLVYSSYPSIMLSHDDIDDLSHFSSIIVGPGWDSGNERLLDLALSSNKGIVIDADAIKLMKGKTLNDNGVITPHVGEYRTLCALLGIDNGLSNARNLAASIKEAANRLKCVVVLKSSAIWISDGHSIFIYDGHNPTLGVAGSGDVLSGIIGALLASGESALDAAINGVIIHQEAGKRARAKYGFYMAEELIGEIVRP